jgi:flagellar biosynthesis/type III secretory pathway protein FliH
MSLPLTARRLSSGQAAAQIGRSDRLAREASETILEARELVEAARAETQRMRALADSQAAGQESALRSVAAETVDRYLDAKRIEAAALAAAQLIHDAGAIRQEFDALAPWLSAFLREAIERLLGELDDEEVIARLVAQGVASLKSAREVTVLMHPGDLRKLEAARLAHPLRFTGVSAIRADARLRPGAVTLQGDGGTVDASLMTQVDILCREIEGVA